MKRAMIIIGSILIAGGGGLLVSAWFMYTSTNDFLASAIRVRAVISSVSQKESDSETYYYPTYSFIDQEGTERSVTSDVGQGEKPDVGDSAWFYYSRENPEKARKDSFFSLWLLPLVFAIAGFVPLLLGLIAILVIPRLPQGTSIPPPHAPDEKTPVTLPNQRTWALMAHLSALSWLIGIPFGSVFGPLTVWLVYRDTSALVEANAREALNFHISMLIYSIVCIVTIIGILALPILFVFSLVQTLRGAIRADAGEIFMYPMSIRLIKGKTMSSPEVKS